MTEWNLATNEPSELHKLAAQLFVYGFYDEHNDRIDLAVAVDVALMQYALSNGELTYVRRPRGDQSFIGIQYQDLHRLGAVLYKHHPGEQVAIA